MANQSFKVTPANGDFIISSTSKSIDETEYNLFCSASELVEILREAEDFNDSEFKLFCENHEYGDCEELSRY